MKSKNQKERVIIFIDGQNMLHSAQDLDIKFKYQKLLPILKKDKNVVGTYFYTAFDSNNERQIGFLNMLTRKGIIVKKRLLKRFSSNGKKEKGIDIWLGIDLVRFADENKYDIALILTGDGDYVPSIEFIISKGRKIELWSWRHALSGDLKKILLQNNNTINYLDDIIDKIKIY